MSQHKRVCSRCGTALGSAAKFCGKCGTSLDANGAAGSAVKVPDAVPLASAADSDTRAQSITWDIDIPLVTNVHMLRSMLKISLGSGLLVGMLVSILLALQGEWKLVPSMLGIFIVGGLGFFLVAVLIMLLLFGNRFRARFSVSADDVLYQTLDRTAKIGARGALILGILGGRPGAASSGLLSMTQENQALKWSGAFSAEGDAARHTIALCNRWRTLMMVYCTPENFAEVQTMVGDRMAEHHTAARSVGKSPVGAYLLRTLLTVLACTPLFILGDVFGYGLLLPLLLMSFALATVWFVRHLAWVVLACSAWIVRPGLSQAYWLQRSRCVRPRSSADKATGATKSSPGTTGRYRHWPWWASSI